MQELAGNFRFQKNSGVTGYDISDHTRKILEKWESGNLSAEPPELARGPSDASVFLIDGKGRFFDGDSGALLVKILKAMHLGKDDVLILDGKNVEKLKRLIRQGRPRMIITLGQEALESIVGGDAGVKTARGNFQRFMGVKVMPTWHPEALLSDKSRKRELWEDMKKVMAFLGL